MASNIDIVRTGYESFIRGDIQTTLAMFAEDIEWHEPEWTYGPASGDFCGRDEVLRRIFAPIPELNDAFALEPREFYCDGDAVIVTGVFNVTPRGARSAVRVPFAHVWTVHGGRIDSLRAYNDVREIVALHAHATPPADAPRPSLPRRAPAAGAAGSRRPGEEWCASECHRP